MAKSTASPTQRVLNIWAIVLILWSIYRVTFHTDLPIWFDECIAKPLIFLFPVFWYITKFEKKPFWSGVGLKGKRIVRELLFGLSVGSVFVILAIGVRLMKHGGFPTFSLAPSSLIWILSTCAAACTEQLLSTGFVFHRLIDESKNMIKPVLLSACLFFFLHVPALFGVEKIANATLIPMIALNVVLSIMTSIVFIMRKNTSAAIVIQALYLLSLPILL